MPMSELTVEQILHRLRDSSRDDASEYCEEIIRRFEPLVRRGWRRAGVGTNFSDFLQDVLVRLFGGLARLRNPKAFPGYFRRIVASVAVDQIRQQARTLQTGELDPDTAVSRIDEEILAGIFVRSYLELLPARERQVLELEFVDGLTPEEIMVRTGLTRGGTSAARSRGISRLRRVLESEAVALERTGRM